MALILIMLAAAASPAQATVFQAKSLRCYRWVYSLESLGMDWGRLVLATEGGRLVLDAALRGPAAKALGERPRRRSGPVSASGPDGLSYLEQLRSMPLAAGDRLRTRLLLEDQRWSLKGRVNKTTFLKLPFGRQRAIHITAKLQRRARRSQAFRVELWLSDDDWRLPLRVRVKGDLSAVEAVLQRSERLSACRAGSPGRRSSR